MFERFSEEARQVVVLAQEAARDLRHNYIGTEHILLGLLREPTSPAGRVLEALGVTLEQVRIDVVRIVGSSPEPSAAQIPFTPRAKKVLELALREALSLGHNYIGPEHILLGLTRENEGVASRILLDLGADAERIRNEVITVLSGPGAPGSRVAPAPPRPIDSTWFRGLELMLAALGKAIRHELGREPDPGDLLLVLASARETISGRAVSELGVDLDALQAAVERLRAEHAQTETAALQEMRRRLGLEDGP